MKQFVFVLTAVLVGTASAGTSEEEGKKYIDEVYQKTLELGQDVAVKLWEAYATTNANSEKAYKDYDDSLKKFDAYQKEAYPKIMSFPWQTFKDPNTKRMFFIESFVEETGLPDDKKAKLAKLQDDIENVNATSLLKEYKGDSKPKLKPVDVDERIMKDYKNAEELTFYWKERHNTIGIPVKNLFTEWVGLENEVARVNHYTDTFKYLVGEYEIDNYENTMKDLLQKTEPLFKELHAYVRYRLWVLYEKKENIIDPKGPIPGSLLGIKGGLDISPMYEILKPYPQKPDIDITPQLKAKGYTGRKMAETAEKYFESLGFPKMPAEFWRDSIFEAKPDMASCASSAFYFSNKKDYRLIFCGGPNTDDFMTMHSMIGILQYNIATKDLNYYYQQMPNDAYDQALVELMRVLSSAPSYLKSLELLDSNVQVDKELEINILFKNALYDVFFLPAGYAYDSWRWSVLEGKITPQNYNCEFWKILTNLQGVEPPVDRDENDFDPGVHPWFVKGNQYMQYFISIFMKCDIIRGLCKAAGYNGDLVFCDINNKKAAGAKLKEMMAIGDSLPWYDSFKKVTGHKNLDASAVLEYYQPLYQWLQEENKKNQVTVGWTPGHNRCR